MEPVTPNRNLSRWEEMDVAQISPSDVYKILKVWKDVDMFNSDHISAMARDIARTLSDQVETPEGGEILYFDYTVRSYDDCDLLMDRYGKRVVSIDEMRDSHGELRQYRVVLSAEKKVL